MMKRWNEILEITRMSVQSLAAHRLRSALSLVGVVVGVFSIIVVMTAMRVLQRNVESELGQLGAHGFGIQKWPSLNFEGPQGWEKYRRRGDLTYEQLVALRERATLAVAVGAEEGFGSGEGRSRYARTNPDLALKGLTPGIFRVRSWNLASGRGLVDADLRSRRRVCVLGHSAADKLFPHGRAVGETIRFRGLKLTVIGRLADQGQRLGGDQGWFIGIPLTLGLEQFGWRRSLTILCEAPDEERFTETVHQVEGALRRIRKVPPGEEDDFEIFSSATLIGEFRNVTLAVRGGVAAISSIALLAAGVGIMNIMLVSVTERTREIGILRALGARRFSIMVQFLAEALLLCEIGGGIGVGLGIMAGNLTSVLLKLPPVIPWDWVGYGLAICTMVGLVFGLGPAWKAAHLDPIESLRYE